jgi:hypothetical protein
MTELREYFYGGWSVYEPSVRDSLASIAENLFELRKLDAERDCRTEQRERQADLRQTTDEYEREAQAASTPRVAKSAAPAGRPDQRRSGRRTGAD